MVLERKTARPQDHAAGKMRVQLRISFDVPIGMTRDDCQNCMYDILNQGFRRSLKDLDSASLRIARNTGRTGKKGTRRIV